ncbi:hypothetical protein A9Q84_10680 [Halobacteriovorax marinus]|uniref:Chloramphenicol phosphotransferase n=1 Tax=Halobacteriovorax marinus TaxID=97084 RepID=A0A1Y5F7B0_9BACT|nr:hypothetical protein A9Q84_10680 [Halobacteriovorax marinus]
MSKIIILNGTSSSGKSSIARELHKKLLKPAWVYLEWDTFINMLPQDHIESREDFLEMVPGVLSGFHSTIRAFADSGVNCIVDHVFQDEDIYFDISKKLKDHEVFFIGLHCPIDILEKRETNRGDRTIGTAERQINKVHRNVSYNLELDSHSLSIDECVKKVILLSSKIENFFI